MVEERLIFMRNFPSRTEMSLNGGQRRYILWTEGSMRRLSWCVVSLSWAWSLGCQPYGAVTDGSAGAGGSGIASGSGGTGQAGGGQAGNAQAGAGQAGSGAVAGHAGVGAGGGTIGGGAAVEPEDPADAERAAIEEVLSAVDGITTEELLSTHAVGFTEPAPYALDSVAGLSLIDASSFVTLSAAGRNDLSARGFAISNNISYPTFLYGYASIYMADLPVYISADSVLFAVHRSYDAILKRIEGALLIQDLRALLDGMRARLLENTAFGSEQVRRDADVYLTVGRRLLANDAANSPVFVENEERIASLTSKANAHAGFETIDLFGSMRYEDFSQYEPRGHYTDDPALGGYFRAMMWLGRVDFRILETQQDGTQRFQRRQLEAALALRELIGAEERTRFDRLDQTIGAFVGEHDYMQLDQLGSLLEDLGVADLAGLSARSDQEIAQAVADANYGAQRISSHIMVNGVGNVTLPLSASFALLGQRYVIDSHVFSNVVYDRVLSSPMRMMPNPLDAAFAAFGNDQAASLLASELGSYGYAPDLAKMRVLADAHDSTFWDANLYNHWLGALRALSPDQAEIADAGSGLPPVARGEAWGRRLLNTQLASWAELRHDTLLYAKQSYTGGQTCEFPDAYVDPYPEFYERIGAYAEYGEALATRLSASPDGAAVAETVRAYFARLKDVAGRLHGMAEYQRSGAPFTAEMLVFVNQAVQIEPGCGSPFVAQEGWYGQLFYDAQANLEFDPTIADVHTQPFDENGSPVGRVLHVGTGEARPMVVIADGCTGPRAYAGLASSYYEVITSNFERLTPEDWGAGQLGLAQDPAWMSDLVR
jgi:hypothetical protein